MKCSIVEYLEDSARKFPNKIAYCDHEEEITFSGLLYKCRCVGSKVANMTNRQQAVVIYMKKNIRNIISFFGVAFAGCYYVPIDETMPKDRVQLIIDILSPEIVIYDNYTECKLDSLYGIKKKILYDDIEQWEYDENILENRMSRVKSTDLLYVLFTSGSTGIPKGVMISHLAVIDFVEWISKKYELDERTSLCNQAPFYFDASVPDIFIPIKTGATTYVPPKSYYTFPKKIIEYVLDKNINTLIWVPSALCNVVDAKVFDILVPECVNLIIFCGEVMPCKYLNKWRKTLPNALYVNMYGPTEATYACTYYNIDREFSDDERLPLGLACENCEVLLINGDRLAQKGEIGEICVVGQCLSYGYLGDSKKTGMMFKQNPFNKLWNEPMYCTGDLGMIDDRNELVYVGRKDSQIKKNGFRIELGEIESAIRSIDGITNVCCIFNEQVNRIISVYTGEIDKVRLNKRLELKLQKYMLPDQYIKLGSMPENINGKVDRAFLKEMIIERKMSLEQLEKQFA